MYEQRAKKMSAGELIFALADIKQTLTIWDKVEHPYTQKLYAEFDAYVVELHRRRKGRWLQ